MDQSIANVTFHLEYDVSGIVVETCKDSAVVSAEINGSTSYNLPFGKDVFFMFGMRFDGQLDNVLDVGMEIEFCYDYSRRQKKPYVVAAWLGERPDNFIMRNSNSLEAVYGKTGVVRCALDRESFLVKFNDADHLVIIHKSVVLRDGYQLKTEGPLLADNELVFFDAVPLNYVHTSGANYQCTCAWIGTSPRLVDRFALVDYDSKLETDKDVKEKIVTGTVVVIPGDIMAFVELETNDVGDKAIMFRSSLGQNCNRIQDVVDVGDKLLLQLRSARIFSSGSRLQWFVTGVLESDIVNENGKRRSIGNGDLGAKKKIKIEKEQVLNEGPVIKVAKTEDTGTSKSLADVDMCSDSLTAPTKYDDPPSLEPTVCLNPSRKQAENSGQVDSAATLNVIRVHRNRPFRKKVTRELGFLINCLGLLDVADGEDNVKLEHIFGTTPVNPKRFGIDFQSTERIDNRIPVYFDAQRLTQRTLSVKRMWTSDGNRPSPLQYLGDKLFYAGANIFTLGEFYVGVVSSIPFHDHALATVGDISVLIPFASVITVEENPAPHSCINEYLCEGLHVRMKIRENSEGNNCRYFEAVETWKATRTLEESNAIEETTARDWKSLWGSGIKSGEGRLVKKRGRYLISFTSSDSNNLELDLFQWGDFIVHGKPIGPDKAEQFVGKNVRFHAACDTAQLSDDPSGKGLFVVIAWIGRKRSVEVFALCKLALKSNLPVIRQNQHYECVVDNFPLPTHAVCKIGPLSVWVALDQVKSGQNTSSHRPGYDLVRGQIIWVRVHLKHIREGAVLISNQACTKSVKSTANVLKHFSGVIVTLPLPTGQIRLFDSNIVVAFELCHLMSSNIAPGNKKDFSSLVSYFVKTMRKGKTVLLSATFNKKSGSYRAIEVRLG